MCFGVFETNRVDLVRHGGRTGRTFYRNLGKVTDGNIAPHIDTETEQDLVEPSDVVVELGHPGVGFNRGRPWDESESECFKQVLGECRPGCGRYGGTGG